MATAPPVAVGIASPPSVTDAGGGSSAPRPMWPLSDPPVETSLTPVEPVGGVAPNTGGSGQPSSGNGDSPPAFATNRLGDLVWVDENGDGLQDTGEPGLNGVTIELVQLDGSHRYSAGTDVQGRYEFANIASGLYRIHFQLPPGFTFTTPYAGDPAFDSDAHADGWTEPIAVDEFTTADESYDAGLRSRASVGDRVWHDNDGNGLQDDGESGFDGIHVELLDESNTIVQSTTTTVDGYYHFNGLLPGAGYQLQFHLPLDYGVTTPFVGPDDRNSDIESDGRSPWFSLDENDTYLDLDAGLVAFATATVGDRVWLDDNGNGIQDQNEMGMGGIGVHLLNSNGMELQFTVTDTNGYYEFTGLIPNAVHQIQFDQLGGFGFTSRYAGDQDVDSDADPFGLTDPFRVGNSLENPNVDCGLVAEEANAEVSIRFVNANGIMTDKLRVAKWEHAFKVDGKQVSVRPDFIRRDRDRFYVFVVDPAANTNPNAIDTINVQMSTTNDKGNDLILNETGANTGRFASRWLLLTSVQLDDEHQVDGIPDNKLDDPTFYVLLGDKVMSIYGANKAEAAVSVEKVVKLHINILRDKAAADGGQPVLSEQHIKADIAWANAIYAPVGIKFTATIQIVDPPPGVDLSDRLNGYPPKLDVNGKIQMTDEERSLLQAGDLRTPSDDDVEVYYVTSFMDRLGESFWVSASPESKYADSIVIGANRTYRTLAHELGHVLLDDGNHATKVGEQVTNLMVGRIEMENRVTDPRRIWAQQARNMMIKRPNLLSDP